MSDFVGFCRLISDKAGRYDHIMEYLNKYVPKEYLALKINYCRKCLEEMPVIYISDRNKNGMLNKKIIVNGHVYNLNSRRGEEYYDLMNLRARYEYRLQLYETVWKFHFKDEPLPECNPHKITRTLLVDDGKPVVMNRSFFDSLKNDDNKNYPKYPSNYFDGIYYRSSAEREIAIFYTNLGIPFKYEPSVKLAGIKKPINPDFVLYLEELDTCKFHEHFGMKDSSDYLTTTKVKYGNYTNAGLIPDLDILFTYDTDEMPFDIRYLSAKLNSAVYGTAIIKIPGT